MVERCYLYWRPDVFDSVDYFSKNILLPLGGMFITFFAIWLLPKGMIEQQLNRNHYE